MLLSKESFKPTFAVSARMVQEVNTYTCDSLRVLEYHVTDCSVGVLAMLVEVHVEVRG